MKSMNRVQLIGWLGKDMTVKTARDGKEYASFRMATDRWHRTNQGETVKKTSWHTVWVWDNKKVAAYKNYLVKGSHVLVEGFLNYRDYTDKSGKINHVAEIKATTLVDLDR
jgi:single-strand DNA-binding protein